MTCTRKVPPTVAALEDRLFSDGEAAAYLALHPRTWRRYWRSHGDLIAARRVVGRRGRWPLRALRAHVEQVCR